MAELKNFILRHEAVKLYRTFLKTIKEAPKDSHGNIAAFPASHSTMHVGDFFIFTARTCRAAARKLLSC